VSTHLSYPDDIPRKKFSGQNMKPVSSRPHRDWYSFDGHPGPVEHPIDDRPVIDVSPIKADLVVIRAPSKVESVSQVPVDVLAPTVANGGSF